VTVFARFDSESVGLPLLFLIGLIQGVAMIAMSATLLGTVAEAFRARVMGVRMLAVYGLPIGLLCAGFLIDRFDYPSAIAIFAAVGLLFTLLIAVRWRESLWE
jgi:MFS family permease